MDWQPFRKPQPTAIAIEAVIVDTSEIKKQRDEARQETLVKSLLGWAGEDGSPLTPTEKAEVEIAYGDIAMQRGQLREAHQIFTRTQNNETYQELPVRNRAALRRIRAERVARNFDGALKTIAELELERITSIWTDLRFARAEVHFDMEEYDDAKDDIDSILARDSSHFQHIRGSS